MNFKKYLPSDAHPPTPLFVMHVLFIMYLLPWWWLIIYIGIVYQIFLSKLNVGLNKVSDLWMVIASVL